MSDIDLLKAAAKAAGITVRESAGVLFTDVAKPSGVVTGREWNPRTNSGDALELAVKLRLDLTWTRDDRDRACAAMPNRAMRGQNAGSDAAGAMRFAIVSAAAALGGFNG